ncbi:putative disease resistance protein RGA1 [Quercus suber]|uniref:putative disease resistance protein RGA1 n=1 Tax=Quercus suber TaxID=58331 RepID=UPI0032DFAE59
MKEKIHLQDLTLSWIEEDVDESNVGYDEESLEALLPHGPLSNLQQLSLNRYGGVKIPSGISSLSNLVKLSLDECNKCQHLPPLDQFHSLKTLSLYKMNDLEYISERENNGEFSDSSFLPSLEQLTIEECRNLKGWWQRQRDSVEEFHNHSLPSFPHLSYLHIWECPKLISLLQEAASESKDSNMKVKIHLQDLKLSWIKEDVDESDVGYDEELLVALLPHGPPSNLQELCLIRYGGVKLPSAISLLSNLVKLSLDDCNKCQHLPPLDQFHSLKTLSLYKMNDLEYISERENNGEFSDSSFLPSLEQLTIGYCRNLKGWWQRQRDSVEEFHNHSLPSFPHLSILQIRICPKLISLPLFPYLEKLELHKCSLKPLEQTLRMEVINTATPKNLTSIAATSTSSSSSLAASSFIPLSKLKSMSIWNMEETLPKELMCNLISLQHLDIENCCGPLPLSRHLTALQNLRVVGSKEVDLTNDGDEMEWHGLQSLRKLNFSYLPNLATLPVGIQHLTSLQTLEIFNCPSLLAIPEWICNLNSLQTLQILDCPILSRRCEREAGEDWSKIAHIPHLLIDRWRTYSYDLELNQTF